MDLSYISQAAYAAQDRDRDKLRDTAKISVVFFFCFYFFKVFCNSIFLHVFTVPSFLHFGKLICVRKCEESLIFVPQWCKLILSCFQKVAADKRERRVIEAVITSCTRNAVVLTGTWVRIPHSPPENTMLTGCFVCEFFL